MKPAYWSVFSRCVAAVAGGYALANSLPVALVALVAFVASFAAGLAPLARSDAVLIAMQLSFLVYTGAVMWAFAASSAWAAWLGLGLPVLLSSLLAWTVL